MFRRLGVGLEELLQQKLCTFCNTLQQSNPWPVAPVLSQTVSLPGSHIGITYGRKFKSVFLC
jgi:hypothetical protein